jgi:hypothetical protein
MLSTHTLLFPLPYEIAKCHYRHMPIHPQPEEGHSTKLPFPMLRKISFETFHTSIPQIKTRLLAFSKKELLQKDRLPPSYTLSAQ